MARRVALTLTLVRFEISLLILLLSAQSSAFACPIEGGRLTINTSNPNKKAEFEEYLKGCELSFTGRDLEEPDSDPVTVIQYKASQFDDPVLVDDASLDVEQADFGVKIKMHIADLEEHPGKKANFNCLLGIRKDGKIQIFQASTPGTLVAKAGNGFGIGPYFLPLGATQTLGQYMDPRFNPRYLALVKFLENRPDFELPLLREWTGKFQ